MIKEIILVGISILLIYIIYKLNKKSQCRQLLDVWESRGELNKQERKEYEQMWKL